MLKYTGEEIRTLIAYEELPANLWQGDDEIEADIQLVIGGNEPILI